MLTMTDFGGTALLRISMQEMVKMDWDVMEEIVFGEPVEKLWLLSAFPLASVPDRPVTVQDFTSLALQVIIELPGL